MPDGAQPKQHVISGSATPESTVDRLSASTNSEFHSRFDAILADIAVRLTASEVDILDREIESAERQVCECLGLDLCAVWQWAAEAPEEFILTHLYRGPDGPPVPERMNAAEFHPWSLAQVLAGRVVVLDSTEDAPPEAARDLETWRQFSVKTTVTVPFIIESGPPFGAVSFNHLGSERKWSAHLISRLQLVGQLFANAIQRKRTEQALRQSEARLQLAVASAGAGLWSFNPATHQFWITDRSRQMFGLGTDEMLTFDRLLDIVHPEDVELLTGELENLLHHRKDHFLEYRIVSADGDVRWVNSRGHFQVLQWGEEETRIMGAVVDVTERKIEEQRLHAALAELEELREQLKGENKYLRERVQVCDASRTIVGDSEPVARMMDEARQVAPTDAAVLITGETGTGKELLAQAVHDLSGRRMGTLVKVNCAALPAALIESELFGRERGAYTGAMTRQTGRFEVADKSTIMLDEIGELPLDLQTKLLRVLEDGSFERLGSNKTTRVDVRVIAATNRDLEAMVAEGTFREDLFHRLNVFPIHVPPLRDRLPDLPQLVWAFVEEFNARMGRSIESIPQENLDGLLNHSWPGNVRELRNAVERAMIVSRGKTLNIELPATKVHREAEPCTLQEVERRHICDVLERTHWRISGKGGAAEVLGMVPTTLHSRMKKLGISRQARG